MSLDDISIKVATDLNSIGSVDALLNEIATRLARFIDTDETSMIDLKSLPFSPDEYEGLRTALGRGEASARLETIGDSELYETHYPGVWWVTHYNVEGDVIADLIEIAAVPAILHSQPEDVRDGLERLQHTLSQNK
ncbi:MAG: hydrogenase expression/formation protein [Gammaproteobacteria bacterium]|nr:hydrogenase expression/formation protein [Gammaproteobacteria bacterium]MBU1625033.1 hydrogenase expression/formation protein [Gammaproteobacteria bacterium]MBU1981293.1 hydrogenase expression/formation protein [Gammaproteobacteria bacterium]